MNMIKLAEIFSTGAHGDQMYGGYRYTYHLKGVVDKTNSLYAESPKLKKLIIIAWLHDIIEDTMVEKEDLLKIGFDEDIVASVVAITKTKNQNYIDYMIQVKYNKMATKIKIADTLANLTQSIKESNAKRVTKYSKQLHLLHLPIEELKALKEKPPL